MSITSEQKQQLQSWVGQGISLSNIQKNIQSDWGQSITYMDLRFLIDDLSVEIPTQKTETPQPDEAVVDPQAQDGVSVEVDKVMRPGTLVSGSVTFSDGKSAKWQLDTMGRIGLIPDEEGYQPKPEDVQSFQAQLKTELQKAGF